jgi:hypothetical protein
VITDHTDALTVGFWVEQTVYNEFNSQVNGGGTYSWEDWAQRTLAYMNTMFEMSRYQLAPDGVLTRVRLDKVTVVPDWTLAMLNSFHAPVEGATDAQWGFAMQEYHNCSAECYGIPWWVIHELTHELLGRVDLYAWDVQDVDVKVLGDDGSPIAGTPQLPHIAYDVVHYMSRIWDAMHVPTPYSLYSDYTTYSLNRDIPPGDRSRRGWTYIYDLPTNTRLRVIDNDGKPMPGVAVSLYQAVPGDGASGPYSQAIDNTPDISGTTDVQGAISLGRKPFGDFECSTVTGGVALLKLRSPQGLTRYTWLEAGDLNMAFWRGERDVYTHTVRFPNGPSRLRLATNTLTFTATTGRSGPSPQVIQVEVLGDAVTYWSVSRPSASWMRTLPSLDIAYGYTAYPPGPLTVIVDPTGLQTGTYTSSVTVRAASALDSPQVITVTLRVVGNHTTFLPLASRNQAAGVVQVSAPAISTENLLTNPGFEEGVYDPHHNPPGWSSASRLPGGFFTWDNSQAHSGSKSVRLSATSPNDAYWTQTVTVTPHTVYTLSAWIKTQEVTHVDGNDWARANIGIYGRYDRTWGVSGTQDWIKLNFLFSACEDRSITVACRLGHWNETVTGTLWCDDLSLTPRP